MIDYLLRHDIVDTKAESTAKAGLLEYSWTALQIFSRRSDNRTLLCYNTLFYTRSGT